MKPNAQPGTENTRALYRRPCFAVGGKWFQTFPDAASRLEGPVPLDTGAVLSMLTYGYVCGDRTMDVRITRRPWLSRINEDGGVSFEDPPRHGLRAMTPPQIAEELKGLLMEEVAAVAEGRDRICLTLSGGLDSRIVAGVVKACLDEGRIACTVTGVTWGHSDSRDVVYAKAVAERLGIEWQHIPLDAEHLWANTRVAGVELGAMVGPVHLHRMTWFRGIDANSLVLSGSYGDSVGRAEFSGQHLLELSPLRVPERRPSLMTLTAFEEGRAQLAADLEALSSRCRSPYPWAVCEWEMEAHYMRSLLGPAMSLIETHCGAYQVFTSPEVYGFMWSIHPALRVDEVYGQLLERLDPGLPRIPWARTNAGLRGVTEGANESLRPRFHSYVEWISRVLLPRYRRLVNPGALEATGVFSADAVSRLLSRVARRHPHSRDCHELAWLGSLSALLRTEAEAVEDVTQVSEVALNGEHARAEKPTRRHPLAAVVNRLLVPARSIRKRLRALRRPVLFRRALAQYPPESR